ncbi:hypothetical protein KEM09_08980 [Carboxylicivirga mesophila]|uniref:Zinc ribbon domain-containing protein n=1 Tax=Carboxylicivirga mesophila TaxID=1166478 RepID=A0ABS5KB10_9BACT|nr:hypothetical protein [Carboxylicivirga mesophila]MBS2211533.1 hypothetical protein [Carboxylicivirga mesophila]
MNIDFLFFMPFIALIAYVFYQAIKLLNNRYFRSYDKEVFSYVDRKGLNVTEVCYPNKLDWKSSPFEQPSSISFGFVLINLFGFITSWTKREYRLIHAVSSKGKARLYWLEIETTFFCKPELTFKEGKVRKEKLKASKNVITNFTNCPACNYELNEQDLTCPECGLNFK